MCTTTGCALDQDLSELRSHVGEFFLQAQGFVNTDGGKSAAQRFARALATSKRLARCANATSDPRAPHITELVTLLERYGPRIRQDDPRSAKVVKEIFHAHRKLDPFLPAPH